MINSDIKEESLCHGVRIISSGFAKTAVGLTVWENGCWWSTSSHDLYSFHSTAHTRFPSIPCPVKSNVIFDIICGAVAASVASEFRERTHTFNKPLAGPENPLHTCSPFLSPKTDLPQKCSIFIPHSAFFKSLAVIQSYTLFPFLYYCHLTIEICIWWKQTFTLTALGGPNILDINSQTKKEMEKWCRLLPSFSLSLEHTHVFFCRRERRSYPDSRGGFHVTESSAKGSKLHPIHFFQIAQCSTVINCQILVMTWGCPSDL